MVVWIDKCALIARRQHAAERFVARPKAVTPAVLIEIVVVQAGAAADHRPGRTSGRVCKTQPGRKCLAIVVWNAGGKRDTECLQGDDRRILVLIAAGGAKQT